MLPSNQTGLATVGIIMLCQKTIRGNFAAKILKTRRAKQKNKRKARGELSASSFRNFDSRETLADLTNQLLANCVNGFRQRILFARHLIPRKYSLCSQGMNNWALKRNWKQWLADAKFRELNKMHYGQCENDEFELLTMTAKCFDFIRLHAVSFIL